MLALRMPVIFLPGEMHHYRVRELGRPFINIYLAYGFLRVALVRVLLP